MTLAIIGGLNIVRIGLLDDQKFDIPYILLNGLRLLPNDHKLVNNIANSIKLYLQLSDECPMLDYSIVGKFMEYGLLEEMTKLLNHPYDKTRIIAEEIIDEYDRTQS